MAEVFLARDQLLDRPVAVKVLFPEFATDASFVERFRREATAAANLTHPNIVGVYDWGEADGTYYIVMEYVDGRTLSEVLGSEGPLHPDRVADVGADVAAALGFAHRNGVVHRDVKPGNVIVTAAGLVKVADFGIARAITENADESLTQVGTVMGTAAYFSPEQARGEAVDPRSDIYSLGCVLYELLVGTPPFSGDTPVSVALKHVQESPTPPRQVNPALPVAIEAIVLKCLAKNPVNRYPSAEDLRADLRRFREGTGILAEPVMVAPVDPGATALVAAVDDPTAAVPAYGLDEEDEDEGRRSGWFLFALLLLLALLAGMLFLLAQALGLGEDDDSVPQVEVPDVIDLPVAEAQTILRDEGLEVEIVEEPNDDAEAGIVFDQDPRFGRKVDEGSTVELKVSQGAAGPVGPRRDRVAVRSGRGAAHGAGVHRRPRRRRRRGHPGRRGGRPEPGGERRGTARLRGPPLGVERTGSPSGARRGRPVGHRGVEPAGPGGLRGPPDRRGLQRRGRGQRHPHRSGGREHAAQGQHRDGRGVERARRVHRPVGRGPHRGQRHQHPPERRLRGRGRGAGHHRGGSGRAGHLPVTGAPTHGAERVDGDHHRRAARRPTDRPRPTG